MKSSTLSATRKLAGVSLGPPYTGPFILKGESSPRQFHPVKPGGKSSHVLLSAGPFVGPGQSAVGDIATLNDITEPWRQVRLLMQEAVRAERRRMAGDIHDMLCQDLQALLLQLKMTEEELPAEAENARLYMRRAQDLAHDVLIEARRTMWAFTHESVNAKDPAIALARRAKQLFADTSVKLGLSLQKGTRPMSPEMRSGLFRIGKEALTNVRKHAQATKVRLELVYRRRQVQLAVEDDGCGIMRAAVPTVESGYGLTSMRQRAERMGGKLVVESQPNRGTRVVALVPFPSQDAPRVCA